MSSVKQLQTKYKTEMIIQMKHMMSQWGGNADFSKEINRSYYDFYLKGSNLMYVKGRDLEKAVTIDLDTAILETFYAHFKSIVSDKEKFITKEFDFILTIDWIKLALAKEWVERMKLQREAVEADYLIEIITEIQRYAVGEGKLEERIVYPYQDESE